jgi:hydroxymethylbilane synthase
LAFLDDASTRFAVTAERTALAALGGGCQVPIGIHCRPGSDEEGSWDEIFAIVADPATGNAVRIFHKAPRVDSDPAALGALTARKLLELGAGRLLQNPGMTSNEALR